MVSTAFNIVFSACVHCQFVAWNIKAEKEKKKKEKSSGLELTAISLGLIGKKWSSSYKETKT